MALSILLHAVDKVNLPWLQRNEEILNFKVLNGLLQFYMEGWYFSLCCVRFPRVYTLQPLWKRFISNMKWAFQVPFISQMKSSYHESTFATQKLTCVFKVRGRSQTTFTKFGFFWPPTPLRLHFIWYESLQKVNFLITYPPPLVNVVCEQPLTITYCACVVLHWIDIAICVCNLHVLVSMVRHCCIHLLGSICVYQLGYGDFHHYQTKEYPICF